MNTSNNCKSAAVKLTYFIGNSDFAGSPYIKELTKLLNYPGQRSVFSFANDPVFELPSVSWVH